MTAFLKASTDGSSMTWFGSEFQSLIVCARKLYFFTFFLSRQLTLWGVRVPDNEIVDYMKLAGLTWPIHKGLVRAHFNMEDTSGSVILDQTGNSFHGNLIGRPAFVPVRNNNLLIQELSRDFRGCV